MSPTIQHFTTTKGVKITRDAANDPVSSPIFSPLPVNTGLFINNEFVAAKDGKTLDTVNPSNGKVIAKVSEAGPEDVDLAVHAAEKAYNDVWSKTSGKTRSRLMHKLADILESHAEELAQIETLDNGKGISFSRGFDVAELIQCFRYYAGWADKIHGKVIDTEGAFSFTRHEPIGVCGAIIPWNFPLLMLAWKIAPALATGNTVVLKTSELTPLSGLKFASLVAEAGFPPGVINIITGYGPRAGDALARHSKVGKIAFTGSTNVGRLVMKAAAESNLKKVTLELGGKSPNIIFDDADLDEAVKWAHHGIFFNHGQTCCAGSRVYVQEGVYDEFLKRFSKISRDTKIGDPFDEGNFQGPQVSETQYNRIMSYIEHGIKEGAKVATGGKRHGTEGYFIEPTVFTDVKEDMKIMQEEIFGPVVAVAKFKTLEEVIEKAHLTEYGLAAAVFTQNVTKALEVSALLKAGTVWVNCVNQLDYNTPFGGYRQSGFGRENGKYALDNYTQIKTVKVNLTRSTRST
ncbi:aldehyde dehydrogenase domain-containing protein [Jimgerdemannia flammicorona]|uniref:Aldehyde dehydrogenase domain-containing protein n=1 Tax=Jimgerdemannia flammicorona TaxID=994334 RepID=A0A433D8H5_9FUNG|nr:aldehyde dehydrogenase domain-containing protein [Jimgerdemannia flammicorona]